MSPSVRLEGKSRLSGSGGPSGDQDLPVGLLSRNQSKRSSSFADIGENLACSSDCSLPQHYFGASYPGGKVKTEANRRVFIRGR